VEIIFYSSPMSSATPVVSAFAELDVPHRRVDLSLEKGETRTAAHRALNPNGKVPTLVVDGTPMFEALAIMQWLGDRFGVARGLWPAPDAPARLTALSWSTWAYVTLGGVIQRMVWSSGRIPGLESETHGRHARGEFDELMGILDETLEGRSYLLGDTFSLVDLIVASTVMYGSMVGGSLASHENVQRWVDRVRSRPSIRAAWGGDAHGAAASAVTTVSV
jgi:GST-like protein